LLLLSLSLSLSLSLPLTLSFFSSRDTIHSLLLFLSYSLLSFCSSFLCVYFFLRLPLACPLLSFVCFSLLFYILSCSVGVSLSLSLWLFYIFCCLPFSLNRYYLENFKFQVKKKMTKEEFVRNNRGINDSEDLPSEYLCQVTSNFLNSFMSTLQFFSD
jgi:hypothetical protein